MVWVDQPKGTPIDLPTKFDTYPVYVNYGRVEFAHRKYHETLKPGISIGDTSACTLGALFRKSDESEKSFILTVQHGVKKFKNAVIQPRSADANKVTKYCHYGIYEDNGNEILLDYAFCEIIDDRRSISNIPLGCNFPINNIKHSVSSDEDTKHEILKVGRASYLTEGEIRDV
ncbi:7999_t:CDS:2 [Funneliformis mosseae]|uniref:7999_t:CDS:1 n=1 Tax=Funneliformis mosseae TaxID=27381 RepID=A0A9N9ETJ5_FUNMO|nr:7999_t:CDS:2 [Funneliformis mosseae]